MLFALSAVTLAALLPSGPAPFSALSSRRRFLTSSVAPTTAALALTTTVLPALADSGPTPVLGGTEVSVVNATLELALGISAVSTGIVGFNRSKLEKKMAEEMRDAQTTIKGLREMAEAGEPLPDVCIVKGTLRAKGAPVTPVVESAPALRSLIGTVKQPTNAWLEVAQKFGTLASSPLREAVDKISGGQLSPEDVAFATEGESGAPLAVDAASLASRKSGVTAGTPFVLSELLVQRLSPHAYETTEEDEDGKVTRRYNVRKPRAWSYNVHYVRQQSSGLKLEGKAGEQARVRLPDFQFRSGAAPPLFLPVADVLTEAVDDFLSSSSKRQLDDYTSPFTFLSSFLALDVTSATDDGGSFQSQEIDDVHTLDQLAAKSPSSEWVWNPHGFYDETKYALPTHAEASVIKYAELKRRMPEARMENMAATPYLKPDQSPMELNKARDSEFGWRVSEIAVPADASVALIAKPIYEPKADAQNPIVLVDPFDANADGTIDMEEKLARKRSPWKFDMCFLTESVDELLVQKTANANAYIGLAVVGTLLAASALNDLSYAAAHPEAIVR